MTDTITESFCERCGTRFSFEQKAQRRRVRIGRVRVLTRGLKNYVANDGMPMSEAMASAQHDEARTGVSRQLDAFHRAFNFCMSCRQYTCANCWNEKVGECLTCAPDLSREVLPAPFPDLPLGGPADDDRPAPADQAVGSSAWPTADLARATLIGAAADDVADAGAPEEPEVPVRLETGVAAPSGVGDDVLTATELEEIETALAAGHPAFEPPEAPRVSPAPAPEPPAVEAAAESAAEPAPEAAVEAAAELAPAPAPESPVEIEAAATLAPEPDTEPQAAESGERVTAARQQTRSLLRRFRPAPRSAATGFERAAGAETAATAAATQEDGAPPAAIEPAAEPAAIEIAAEGATELAQPEPDAPRADTPAPADAIEQPTWRVVAPEAPSTPGSSWPDAPAWPSPDPRATQAGRAPGSAAAPWASRLATARPEPPNVWAASSQEVLAAPGPAAASRPGLPAVQACVSCGLSLSANARFCRRCGSRQG
jgi:hypothetical protein